MCDFDVIDNGNVWQLDLSQLNVRGDFPDENVALILRCSYENQSAILAHTEAGELGADALKSVLLWPQEALLDLWCCIIDGACLVGGF